MYNLTEIRLKMLSKQHAVTPEPEAGLLQQYEGEPCVPIQVMQSQCLATEFNISCNK